MRRFRSHRRRVVALLTGPNLWISHINESSLESFGAFFPASLSNNIIVRGACRNIHLSRIMYQDYSGNYDTSSRGSSTSPVQPDSFTSGSSTIGSPISTSSYQVSPNNLLFSDLPVSVHATFHLCACWPHLLSFRDSPSRLEGKDEPSDTNRICF